MMAAAKSKGLATWLALLAGSLGAHRFYLHGWRDGWAWAHPAPTLLGLVGAIRMHELGQDDRIAALLIPIFGLMLSLGAFAAIVIGLTPDERWDARHNPGQPVRATRWTPVLGAIAALLLGGSALMGTIAFGGQRYFEWRHEVQAAHPPAR